MLKFLQLQEPKRCCCQQRADPQAPSVIPVSPQGRKVCPRQSCRAVPQSCLWARYSTCSSAQSEWLFRVLSVQQPVPQGLWFVALFPPHLSLQQGGRGSTLASLCLGRSGSSLCLTKGFNFHCLSFVSLFIQIDFPSLIDANLIVQESAKGN